MFNKIWAQDKMYILVDTWLGLNIFTYHLVVVLAPNNKQHFCRPLKLEKYVIH
jgi:hypothetical protein